LLTEETGLAFGLEEANDRKRSPSMAVLMGKMVGARSNVPLDRLQEGITAKEAVQFLRGILLGYKLGAGRMFPGPQTLRHLRSEGDGE
jgi:hypothetical protein